MLVSKALLVLGRKKTKKPSFGFGFASEKKEPLVNQNDGFGKKKVETPLSFGNTNASKQSSSGVEGRKLRSHPLDSVYK